MYTFDDLLTLLQPKECYDQVRGKCRDLWNSFSPVQQQNIFCRIEEKKKRREFVDYNPLLAIRKNMEGPRPQVLTYYEYVGRFGTTEEKDGWRRVFQPEKQRTIYVKH